MADSPEAEIKTIMKRDGRMQLFRRSKLLERIKHATLPRDHDVVNTDRLYSKVIAGLTTGNRAEDVDLLLANVSAQMTSEDPAYADVAVCVELARLHKDTPRQFSTAMQDAYRRGRLTQETWQMIHAVADDLDAGVVHAYDRRFDFVALRALRDGYLLRDGTRILERPQHLFMRVAITLCSSRGVEEVLKSYEAMAKGFYIHGSPCLFNAGTPDGPLSSCYLPQLHGGTDGLFTTLSEIATLASGGGGIGVGLQSVPSVGGGRTKGLTCGLPPVLRLLDSSVALLTQGDNRRPAAVTVYIEPWHRDILAMLDLKRAHTDAAARTDSLFYALWVPDLFMNRVKCDQDWSLFNPVDVPALPSTCSQAFSDAYHGYEASEISRTSVSARELWKSILRSQIETGGPFILYKDSINGKSNQKHLGVITHGNLCTEVVQYSRGSETAVCNLASLILPAFIEGGAFNLSSLHSYTKLVVRNLNQVVLANSQTLITCAISDSVHRAIGVGVQGLADAFVKLGLPYESEGARSLNYDIAQTIYHAALEASCEMADTVGVHSSFPGSPASKGHLQFDLWQHTPRNDMYDWPALRNKIKEHGLANALLIAYMPTAGTSLITGVSETVDPNLSNVYSRRVKSGDYQIILPTLVEHLRRLSLWCPEVKESILLREGSIQHLHQIPQECRDLYKTVWEIKQRTLIDYAVDRGPFTCQSQSLTLYIEHPTVDKLTSLHFYGWKMGLKTGMYYLRTKPASRPIPVSLSHSSVLVNDMDGGGGRACGSPLECVGCSS